MVFDHHANGQVPGRPTGRLDSWKEIAAYLRRDIKTAQRWERREGLPVHRLHHDKLGSVYAYPEELDAWVASRRSPTTANDRPEVGGAYGTDLDRLAVRAPNDAGPHPPPPADDEGLGTRWRQPRSRRLLAAVTLVAAAIAAWAAWRSGRPMAADGTRLVFLVEPPHDTVFADTLVDPEPTLSPDGTRIVFRAAERLTGRQRLYLRHLDRPTAEALAGTEQGMQPFWSPDSSQIAFFSGGALKRIDLSSQVVTTVAAAPQPKGGAWLPSGAILFSPGFGAGIHVVNAAGGVAVAVTIVDRSAGQTQHVAPQPGPDGSSFLFLAECARPHENSIWVSEADADGAGFAGPRRVGPAERMGRFAPGRWFLCFRGRRLVAQRFNSTTALLTGPVRELAETLEGDDSNSLLPGFSVSSTGTIAYWPVTRTPQARLTWFDRQGRQTDTVGPPGDYPFVALAPDGRRAAVQRTDEATGAPDIWVQDLASGGATRLTASSVNEEDPVWSPDGDEIAFAKHPSIGAEAEIWRLRRSEPLVERGFRTSVAGHPTDWSRDGRLIVFQRPSPETQSDLFALPLPDGKAIALVNSPFNERHGRLSPDGRFVAYSSDVSGRFEVYVKALGQSGTVTRVSDAGGAHPRWRRDGHELFYLSAGGLLTAVPVAPKPRFRAGRPMPLFDARPPLPLPFLDTLYDATADGQRFLVAATERPVTRSFTVVINALDALRP